MTGLTRETKWTEFIKEHFSDIRAPFSAGIELHPSCNFKCVHCYAESDRRTNKRQLTIDQFKNVIDCLVDNSCLDLFFTGGEALLYSGFEELYVYAKKKGLMVSVLTNGSLITEEHISLWKEYPPELISITLYGDSPETYTNLTCNRQGYKCVHNAIDLLKNNGIPFELKCIGMKQNKDDIINMRNYMRSLGLRKTTLAWDIRPMNNGDKTPINYRLSPEEAFFIELQDFERKAFYDKLKFNPERNKPTKRQLEGYLYPCEIAYQFVYITSDGYMQGCVKAVKTKYDLINGTFAEGWEFLGKELYEKKASDNFPCTKCDKFKYCEQCTAAFFDENNDPEKPVTFFCELGELRKKYMNGQL